MSIFQFKQFQIKQEQSAMKIGTDSVLLGCLCDVLDATNILDIGTGTGLLSLILAQKSEAKIDAVEIEYLAYEEAKFNFNSSIWSNRLHAHHQSLQLFQSALPYDLIISNPPYFTHEKNYNIQDKSRRQARQDMDLSFEDLQEHASRLLSLNGHFWLILPVEQAIVFSEIMIHSGWFLTKQILLQPKYGKLPNRKIMCWSKQDIPCINSQLTIYDDKGHYTPAYKHATIDYLLWEGKK